MKTCAGKFEVKKYPLNDTWPSELRMVVNLWKFTWQGFENACTDIAVCWIIIYGLTRAHFPGWEQLIPEVWKAMFLTDIETSQGTILEKTNQVTRYVESVKKKPVISSFATTVGRGNPGIYDDVIPRNESWNFAEIFVQGEG